MVSIFIPFLTIRIFFCQTTHLGSLSFRNSLLGSVHLVLDVGEELPDVVVGGPQVLYGVGEGSLGVAPGRLATRRPTVVPTLEGGTCYWGVV